MQREWSGAVTLLELSTVALSSFHAGVKTQMRGSSRKRKTIGIERKMQDKQNRMGWWWIMTAKFSSNDVFVFWWIGGESDRPQVTTLSYLLPPLDNGTDWKQTSIFTNTHTQTHKCYYQHRPLGVDERLQHSWAEGKSPLRPTATCGELGSIDQRRWLCALPPVEGYRTTQTHTCAHDQVTWRCTQLASWFDTDLKADLAGWLHHSLLLSCPSSLTCIPLLNTMKCSAAQPVTLVERQPVLSVFSTLPFSWLGEMFVSLLHQYPFIDVTFFVWLTAMATGAKETLKNLVKSTFFEDNRCVSPQVLNRCFSFSFKHLGQSCLANVQRNPKELWGPCKGFSFPKVWKIRSWAPWMGWRV